MIDFKLTSNGDIALAPARQYPSFTVDFYIPTTGRNKKACRHPALRLDFDTDIPAYNPCARPFLIEFETDLRTSYVTPITSTPVRDNEELAQEILIRLKTELGEFTLLSSLGSEIVLTRHEDIRSETVLEQVRQNVLNAIADVDMPNEYEVTVQWVDDESRFKYERLKIVIDTGRTTIYDATI